MTTLFPTAHFIKEIGRGVKGARSLSQADAGELFNAMLHGQVSDLELGAILLAMRIKGESVAEIAGFLESAEKSFQLLQAPNSADCEYAPIVIPSYNGARRVANLTPLLAMLLARAGAPVLVHGVQKDAGRVTSAEIFQELGIAASSSLEQAEQQLNQPQPVFMPIEILAPRLAQMLALRRILGVRNSTHTLVKIMQPFVQPALRLTSYTHPEYLSMLSDYFANAADPARGDVFLMRGTEGETVANTKKVQQIAWFHAGQKNTLIEAEHGTDLALTVPVDATVTALWIKEVLAGRESVPENIAEQVRHCLSVAKRLKALV
ncbi:DNA-binding protein YbiB [Solimicrobium silvestre]|uniref:Anthranilate phosphoribosyltransferase n=1 Tax=Solimicrobium silvestre TaxID=2099400 RepID=A0A2S9GYF9_9BURK|nr:DNA-binding protein YbiB [Solimicrobium silvestre]PRC92762.1 Anthranilate phosphoribosyltransferase [Solimicrobium silvestre]